MPIEIQIQIKVKPNARQSGLQQQADGSWTAQLKSPPVDGKANAGLVELVGRHLGVPKSKVQVVQGHASRVKRVEVLD